MRLQSAHIAKNVLRFRRPAQHRRRAAAIPLRPKQDRAASMLTSEAIARQ